MNGQQDPTDNFIVRKILEGCRRSRRQSDSRAPITLPILTKIVHALPHVCFSDYETKLFTAAYLLAYYGMLRVSEVVFTSQEQADKPLRLSDLVVEPGGQAIQVCIRFSKTNQWGAPTILRIPTYNGSYKSVCCVGALTQFLSIRPTYQGFLFCHADKSPLTQSQFSGVLSKAICYLGLPGGIYKSHSFRIGRATSLALQGMPSEAIQKMGRWQSNAYKKYIRMDM